jgi:hypothetical protein
VKTVTDTHLAQDELFPSQHTNEPREIRCDVCGEHEPFDGWDSCLRCGVAASLQEDPDYLYTARRLYAHKRHWMARLEAEWLRQSTALLSSGLMVTTPVQGFSAETLAWLKGLGVEETV